MARRAIYAPTRQGVRPYGITMTGQVISGLSELMLMAAASNDPICAKLLKIKEQSNRLRHITRNVMSITAYETRDYVSGRKVDIYKSSKENDT